MLRGLKKYLCNPWKNNVTRGCGFLEYFLAIQRARIANRFISYGHRNGRVLDIGCGSYPIFLITSKFVEKFGIEKMNYPQERLLRKLKLINYDIEDSDNLPFDDEYIDVVTMLAVLEHIKYLSLSNVISEVYRILKPGGLFIITVPSPHSDSLLNIMAKLGLISRIEMDDHKINLSNAELVKLLRKSKFNNIKYGYFECYLNRWFIAEK